MIESMALYKQKLCLWSWSLEMGRFHWSQLSQCTWITLQLCETYILIYLL